MPHEFYFFSIFKLQWSWIRVMCREIVSLCVLNFLERWRCNGFDDPVTLCELSSKTRQSIYYHIKYFNFFKNHKRIWSVLDDNFGIYISFCHINRMKVECGNSVQRFIIWKLILFLISSATVSHSYGTVLFLLKFYHRQCIAHILLHSNKQNWLVKLYWTCPSFCGSSFGIETFV